MKKKIIIYLMNHVFYKKDFYQYLNTENMSQISAISLMD